MTTPHDLTSLLTAAARALASRDAHAIERLAAVSDGWLQSEAEAEAQRHLLDVMAEAAYLLEGEASEFSEAAAFLASESAGA